MLLLFAFAGLALASCPSNQVISGRQCTVTCGQDRVGGDYSSMKLSCFQECIEACGKDAKCLTAQYHEPSGYCYLKNEIKSATSCKDVDSVVCSSGSITTCPAKTVTAFSTKTETQQCTTKVSTATVTTTSTASAQTVTTTFTASAQTVTATTTASAQTITATITAPVQTVTATTTTTAPGVVIPPLTTTVTSSTTQTVSTTITQTVTTTQSVLPSRTPATGNCVDGKRVVQGQDTYVELCNVAFDGNDIPASDGDGDVDIKTTEDCAALCQKYQAQGCIAALFDNAVRNSHNSRCFLKNALSQPKANNNINIVYKLRSS